METNYLLGIALLGGLGTFLLRYLPLCLRDRSSAEANTNPTPAQQLLQRTLRAIGPAAIVALIVLSVYDELAPQEDWLEHAVPVIVGAIGVVVGKRLGRGSIALSLCVGVLSYAITVACISGIA